MPTGWLKCNGALLSRTTYAALFAVIGTTYGAGDGSTTFALPDLRGEFLRGLDDGRGVDGGRALGSAQRGSLSMFVASVADGRLLQLNANNGGVSALGLDSVANYVYSIDTSHQYAVNVVNGAVGTAWGFGAVDYNYVGSTRPHNVALNFIIKY